MSENIFHKAPVAFIQRRDNLVKGPSGIQARSKRRYQKEIEELKAKNPCQEPHPQHSDYLCTHRYLNAVVDYNKVRVTSTSAQAMEPTNAQLRIVTPGAKGFGCQGGFYISPATRIGQAASTGLSPAMVKNLPDEVHTLSSTFLKVQLGTAALIYAYIYNSGGGSCKFLKCTNTEPEQEVNYLAWELFDGTTTKYYSKRDLMHRETIAADDVLYSDEACTTPAGVVDVVFLPQSISYLSNVFAGFCRSAESDTTIGQTNYYGWFSINGELDMDFPVVYTKSEQPLADASFYMIDRRTGQMVEFPSASCKVVTWSNPCTLMDVDLTTEAPGGGGKLVPGKKLSSNVAESNEIKHAEGVDELEPLVSTVRFYVRGMLTAYVMQPFLKRFKLKDTSETPAELGTFTFDDTFDFTDFKDSYRWKNSDTAAALQYVYTTTNSIYIDTEYPSDSTSVYADAECETFLGYPYYYGATPDPTQDIAVLDGIVYKGYAAPNGNVLQPEEVEVYAAFDTTSSTRETTVYEPVYGVNIDSYITNALWDTTHFGYGEVSSQTTLYTETAFRYLAFDEYAAKHVPEGWTSQAYGVIIEADSSRDYFGSRQILGICNSDYLTDGAIVCYLIPFIEDNETPDLLSTYHDKVPAYVYDASLNAIYGTTFGLDEMVDGVKHVYHYVSDATKNYKGTDGKQVFHFACVDDPDMDLYTKTLSYGFNDLFFADGSKLIAGTHTLSYQGLIPYSHLMSDESHGSTNFAAWYAFNHVDITGVGGFTFQTTEESSTVNWTTERVYGYDTYGCEHIVTNDEDTRRASFYDLSAPISGTEEPVQMYAWCNTLPESYSECFFTQSSTPSVGDTIYEYDGSHFTPSEDFTVQSYHPAVPMYAWWGHDTDYNHSETFYTDTLSPVDTSHTGTAIWKETDGYWHIVSNIYSVINKTTTWYQFYTSDIEQVSLLVSRHTSFWADARDLSGYKGINFMASNYHPTTGVATSPNLSSPLNVGLVHSCYIAPVGEITVTYDGVDYDCTQSYNDENYEFRGVLYSGWYSEDLKETFYTARITPRLTDKLYRQDANGLTPVTDVTIKKVTSVVDLIYPGRQPEA